MQTIEVDDTFDPALDRLDQMHYASAPCEPDYDRYDRERPLPLTGRKRAPRRKREPACGYCYWGWVDLAGGGSGRCRDCNLPVRVMRRHRGREIRLGRRVVEGWRRKPHMMARVGHYLARTGPFDNEAPF